MGEAARVLADLRWLLLSPALLNDQVAAGFDRPGDAIAIQRFEGVERAAIESWLSELSVSGELIAAFAGSGPARLGRYAERLLGFYLTQGPLHRALATHLAVRSRTHSSENRSQTAGQTGGQTTGEIDALLTDSAGRKWHWELAVKFYLCISQSDTALADQLIGPNRRDSMANKIEKLFGRQLRQTPPSPWNEYCWRRAAVVRGMIFYRYGRARARCDALAVDHCRGWWIPAHAAGELPDEVYATVPRLRWMVPVPGLNPALLLQGRQAVLAHLSGAQAQAGSGSPESAVMLVRLAWDKGEWQEQDRGFVVSWD